MATLTQLSSKKFGQLKIAPNAHINNASKRHVINLSAIEISNAATCFPLFITRNTTNGGWAFSAMTSFEPGQNLYIKDNKWTPVFNPASLRTYPLFLMQSTDNSESYTIGFDQQSDDFSDTDGIDLFNDDGSATQHLSDITRMLDSELTNIKQTYDFGNTLEQHGLLKELDLKVIYKDGTNNVIKGLHTIDEDALQALDSETLSQLNKSGYLTPIHALLVSLYQLNVLLDKNNALASKPPISEVKMEVSKEFTHS